MGKKVIQKPQLTWVLILALPLTSSAANGCVTIENITLWVKYTVTEGDQTLDGKNRMYNDVVL